MRAISLSALGGLFVIFWSSGWIVSRFAVEEISFVTLLTLRYLIVFTVLLVFLLISGHWKTINQINIRAHLLVGVLSHAVFLLAGVGAFEMGATAAIVAFVASLQPMLTATLSRSVTSEHVSLRQWLGLIIGLCAVLLLASDGHKQGLNGYALTLPFLAALALSIGTLIYRRIELTNEIQKKKPTPVALILFLHCVGALSIFIPMRIMCGKVEVNFGIDQWLVILWLALVVSLGAYSLLVLLLRHLSTLQASSLTYLIPPATMVQAYLVFGDSISKLDVAALFIAALGVILVLGNAHDDKLDSSSEYESRPQTSSLIKLKAATGKNVNQPLRCDIEL